MELLTCEVAEIPESFYNLMNELREATMPIFQSLPLISGTAQIEVPKYDNLEEQDTTTVFMDYHIYVRPCRDWAAEYDQSEPYVLVGRSPGKKVKAYLTPLELDRLEDKVHDLANGVTE